MSAVVSDQRVHAPTSGSLYGRAQQQRSHSRVVALILWAMRSMRPAASPRVRATDSARAAVLASSPARSPRRPSSSASSAAIRRSASESWSGEGDGGHHGDAAVADLAERASQLRDLAIEPGRKPLEMAFPRHRCTPSGNCGPAMTTLICAMLRPRSQTGPGDAEPGPTSARIALRVAPARSSRRATSVLALLNALPRASAPSSSTARLARSSCITASSSSRLARAASACARRATAASS